MLKKSMTKATLLLILLAITVTGCGGNAQYISIATGGTAGTYYPLGGALSKTFNENIDGIAVNVESTGASAENVELIAKGDAELAFIQNDITYYASTATEIYKGKEKIENMRGMAMIYPELVQIIVTKKSGIQSVSDLKGKKVAIGAPGSGVEANARQVLEVHGLSYDDLAKADYLSFNEAADQLKNNQIDAAFITAGIPTSAVTEVAQTSDIEVISIAADKIDELIQKYPYYTEADIPKETYKDQKDDRITVAVMAMLVVPEKLDEELVYNMTKTIFEQKKKIADTHDRGNDIQLETALTGMPIDVHPGAMKYYEEQGIIK